MEDMRRSFEEALEHELQERKQLRADFMAMQMDLNAQARHTNELTRELNRTRTIMAEKLQCGAACACACRAAAPGQAQQPPRAKRKSTDQAISLSGEQRVGAWRVAAAARAGAGPCAKLRAC